MDLTLGITLSCRTSRLQRSELLWGVTLCRWMSVSLSFKGSRKNSSCPAGPLMVKAPCPFELL